MLGRVASLPVRFSSADAANLYLISLIAPARKETHVEWPVVRGGWRVGIMPAVDGAPAAILVASLGPLPEARRCGQDAARETEESAKSSLTWLVRRSRTACL